MTFGDVNAVHERLLQEVLLRETSMDVACLVSGRAVPRNLRRQCAAPHLVRHATNALIDNEAPLDERGATKLLCRS